MFFKRILSPREHRGERRNSADLHVHDRSLSTSLSQGHLPSVPSNPIITTSNSAVSVGLQHSQRQHGRPASTEGDSVVVENVIYSEPTPLDRVPRSSGNGDRSPDQPPLPPRPISVAHPPHQMGDREEEFYTSPVVPAAVAARERDRRIMRMHDLTMSQKARQGMHVRGPQPSSSVTSVSSGHRRTRSIGQVIDNSEYSTPWNLVEEQMKAAGPPPVKSSHKTSVGRVYPSISGEESDKIIPVSSPPPILGSRDRCRSHSASPTPRSSSDHRSQSPADMAEREAEYDDPWDVRFRNISHNLQDSHTHSTHSSHDRPSSPHSNSNVAPFPSSHSAGSVCGGDSRPPKPPHTALHTDRLRHLSPEEHGNRAHPGGGSESGGRNYGGQFRLRSTTELHGTAGVPGGLGSMPSRTSSVSIPIQQRPLPQAPMDGRESGLSISREDSPPSGWFDSNLPLEEQL